MCVYIYIFLSKITPVKPKKAVRFPTVDGRVPPVAPAQQRDQDKAADRINCGA